MALTMVHLLVADAWARRHPAYLDCPEYYLGAISPDAIHVRDHDDKSHKDEIHLYNWRFLHREPVEAYWHDHRAPFDVGYGVHVLTDCQWVPRYREKLPAIMKPDGRLDVDIYYNDTFVTDFDFYSHLPRLEALLQLIARAEAPEDHPLLTAHEFAEWRRVILDTYRKPCPKHDPVRLIDRPYVESFVDDSIALIDEIFGAVYGAGGDLSNHNLTSVDS